MPDSRLTLAQLDELTGGKLRLASLEQRQTVYAIRQQALEQHIAEVLLQAEARRLGLKNQNELMVKHVIGAAPQPTDDQVRAFYDDHQDELVTTEFEEVADDIREHLHEQAVGQSYRALLGRLRQEAQVRVQLRPVRVAVEGTGPARGPASAPVTIIAFSDFECPHCAASAAVLVQAAQRYGDQLRIVFRNFPLSFHATAARAAEAALCADKQGKFWPMHDRLFAAQDQHDDEQLAAQARAIAGLDPTAFDRCLETRETAQAVQEDIEAGENAGVDGTPFFFVNGVAISGGVDLDTLAAYVDRELQWQREQSASR